MGRQMLKGAVSLAVAIALGLSGPMTSARAAPVEDEVALERLANGLGVLTDIDAPPGDHRVFFSDLAGRIRIWERGRVLSTPFLSITGLNASGEHGLLGFAFHPEYQSNGKLYVHYVNAALTTRIAEYTVSANPDRIDPGSERVLFETSQPHSNHNGGSIEFGPDGYLYIALGDGGGQHDPSGTSQNLNTYLGSILRIDVDSGAPYSIPDGNPFVGSPGLDEIWAYGFRNPWRMSWDLEENLLYVADVGQGSREEVNVLEPGSSGGNYGWDVMEGSLCHEPPSGCDKSNKVVPDIEYSHVEGNSITGGVVYRGRWLPRLRGHYFYSDWGSGFIRSFRYADGEVTVERDWTPLLGTHTRISSFGSDGFGELYFVTSSGSIYRFVSDSPPLCDFDGDGFDDQPVGVPGEDVTGAVDAGAVNILYGAGKGLKASGDQMITQDSQGIRNSAEEGDGFGSVSVCGDFNGDGFADLAVGSPGEDVSGDADGGAVQVLYGSPSGVTGAEDQFWSQDSPGIANRVEPGDQFGATLAGGDFDGDGYTDLAIGAPGEDLGGNVDAGSVHVLYGSSSGLSAAEGDFWSQNVDTVKNRVEALDRFGSAVTRGDFDGDGIDDLAIGVPGEGVSGTAGAGMANVLYGSPSGLTSTGNQAWTQETPGIANPAETGDGFGSALAAGDFDADGHEDLAIGVPNEGVAGNGEAGAVHVIRGSTSGLTAAGDQYWTQNSTGVANRVETEDHFGRELAVGDFDGGGHDDLAIGVPNEGVSGVQVAGAVNVLYGSGTGLVGANDQFLHQGQPGVGTALEADDLFGMHLSAQDINSDGRGDLIIGVPGEDIAGHADAGMAHVIYGSSNGLESDDIDNWHQDKPGVLDVAESGDAFGVVHRPN